MNYGARKEFLEDGGKPDEEQRQRWTELQEKAKYHTTRAAELARASS